MKSKHHYSVPLAILLVLLTRPLHAALLAPVDPVKIKVAPQSQTVPQGSDVTLSVIADGNPIYYQWSFNGLPLLGATSRVLGLQNVSALSSGSYSVRVWNLKSSEVSPAAKIEVFAPPTILQAPQPLNLLPGATGLLGVVASAIPSPSFRWALNGTYIPGADDPLLILTEVSGLSGGNYTVTVFNEYGAVNSSVAPVQIGALPLPFADNFADRGQIQGMFGYGTGKNIGASREANEPKHAGKTGGGSVWLSWVAPADGLMTLSTTGSGFDTLLAVYRAQGPGLENLAPVASDDEDGGFHTSQLGFAVQGGVRYEIAVDGFNGAAGNLTLSWQLAASNVMPLTITKQPEHTTVSLGAPASLSIDFLAGVGIGNVLVQWFLDNQAVIGATQPTLVIPSVQPAQLGSYRARLTLAGQTLFSESAEVQINTEGISEAYAANRLADAGGIGGGLVARQSAKNGRIRIMTTSVRGYSGTQMFQTYTGKDPGEPNVCGVVGGASYWISYQPPENGTVHIDTQGSNFDTLLGVYIDDGRNLGYSSLVCVTCDDNSGSDGRTSSLNFQGTAGKMYYVVVDGVYGATGTAYLNYNLSPQINHPPVARSDSFSRPPNKNLQIYVPTALSNDSDPDGNTVTLASVAASSYYGGRITWNGTWIYYYAPSVMNSNYYATDSISYSVSDGKGGTCTTTISISTNPSSTSASYGSYAF